MCTKRIIPKAFLIQTMIRLKPLTFII
jgi:hypothetical protein